ncbi:FIMAH domain-containing protein [Niallia sp. Krafla_26]|uniref:FIMAH domain-containing protein n=1 Tax=Niallia sp. Krafla_26 TaxID=3064703 RepID=UPI003D17CE20
MRSTTEKLIQVLLVAAIFLSMIGVNVSAAESPSEAVTTFESLVSEVSKSQTADEKVIVKLDSDLTFTSNLFIKGNVELYAESPVILNLSNQRISVEAGATLTIGDNITVFQPSTGEGHPVVVRDNATLNVVNAKLESQFVSSSAYTIDAVGPNIKVNLDNATVTTVKGRAVYTNTQSNVITIKDSTITATDAAGYALYRGNYVLQGSTTTFGRQGGGAAVYDFRNVTLQVTPDPSNFTSRNEITIQKNGDGAELATGSTIYYTTDGSNPTSSETAKEFTAPFKIPVHTIVKAVVGKDGYYGTVQEYNYNTDTDAVPGNVASINDLDVVTVYTGSAMSDLVLPEALSVTLDDGRQKYVAVTWDTSSLDLNTLGDYTLEGALVLPGTITNVNNLKASLMIHVAETEIVEYEMAPAVFLKEGKTSVQPNATVATFSAKGGDGRNYRYELDIDPSAANDNSQFAIVNNALIVGDQALVAGTYKVSVSVYSGSKSMSQSFNLTVDPSDPKWDIINPYEGINWDATHQVKTALHNHTINTNAPIGEWSDGVSGTVDSRVAAYESQGFGALAITEHDYVSYPWSDYGVTDSSMLSIPGNELSKNQHMLSYFSTYYDRKGEGRDVTNGMAQNIKNVGELGGFLYIAHPKRTSGAEQDPTGNLSLLQNPHVVGIEVLNTGQFTNNHSEKIWDMLLTETMPNRNIWGTASDDTHSDGLHHLGAGWTTMLLSDLNQNDAREALINGQTYFSSYRVEMGKDDNKTNPGIPAPVINSISVDNHAGTITLDVKGADKIEWISANGVKVAEGNMIHVNTTPGVSKYVRARMYGPGGQTMIQPFGIKDSNSKDTQKPVITLDEAVPTNAATGDFIHLPTATATDNVDGTVFPYPNVMDPNGNAIVALDNELMITMRGTYTITYRAKDSSGNLTNDVYKIEVSSPEPIKVSDIMKAVDDFDKAGEFANNGVARSLRVHLTSVERFESKNEAEKVLKHMNSFKQLLENRNKYISKTAYETLEADADTLIVNWE